DRLEAGQHVGRRLRKERVGVEKVRPAEQVEQRRLRRLEMLLRPCGDARRLTLLEGRERGIELARMRAPTRRLRQRSKRRAVGDRQSGEEFRGVVGGGVRAARGRCCENDKARENRNNDLHRAHFWITAFSAGACAAWLAASA